MIELDCQQGGPEWEAVRLGIPTASEFKRIITPGKLRLSSQRSVYMNELLAEWALGYRPDPFEGNVWTERGKELEPEARALYEFDRELTPRQVGFCFREESRQVGCSPDWLVDPDGGAEVKCPKVSTHIGFLLGAEVPDAYKPQIQGSLWITGREWWDFVSYAPGLPALIVREYPDTQWQDALSAQIPEFLEELAAARTRLRAFGIKSPAVAEDHSQD